MVRYPHTGVISFASGSRVNATTGIYSPGSLTSISIQCNAIPQTSGFQKFVAGKDGDKVLYSFAVFCPVITRTIPDGAFISLFGRDHKIVQLFNFQKHCEIKVQ